MLLKSMALSILACILWGEPALAVEEPAFKSILKEGAFELRDYPALIVAEVHVPGDQKQAASTGFKLLAGYIFGGNQRRGAAVSAAATGEPTNEKIAMTAPVTQIHTGDEWTVRFTMPSGYTLASLPEPKDPKVTLKQVLPGRFAVLQFSGLASKTDVDAKSAELLDAVKRRQLKPIGLVSLAQYNPPWTPWFMRRNEVLIAIEVSR